MIHPLRFMAPALLAASVSLTSPALAATTVVVNFDDLPSGVGGLVPDNYGGIDWNGNFAHYDTPREGREYSPASGLTTIYPNYDRFPVGAPSTPISFNFDTAVRFDGAFFSAGRDPGLPVAYELFLDGVQVAASGPFTTYRDAGFFASGYGGLVDEVRILATNGYWVMDNVTYTTGVISAVPEPGTWAMMIVGFGVVGAAARRRPQVRSSVAATV